MTDETLTDETPPRRRPGQPEAEILTVLGAATARLTPRQVRDRL